MFLPIVILFSLLAYGELKVVGAVFEWLALQSSGFTAAALIALSFLFMAALGARLILFQGQSYIDTLKRTGMTGGLPKTNPLMFLAGLLFILPGYVSDFAALLCLFPPTAWVIKKIFARALKRLSESGRVHTYSAYSGGFRGASQAQHQPEPTRLSSDPTVIDVEFVEK